MVKIEIKKLYKIRVENDGGDNINALEQSFTSKEKAEKFLEIIKDLSMVLGNGHIRVPIIQD